MTAILDHPDHGAGDLHVPPQDLPAEQAVIGSMLMATDAIADASELLTSDDFYLPRHGVIFDAIAALTERGEPADAITVPEELLRTGHLQKIGGAAYLHTCMTRTPTSVNVGYYAQIVREKAQLRRLIAAADLIKRMAFSNPDGDQVAEILDRAQSSVFDATQPYQGHGTGLQHVKDVAAEVIFQLNDDQPRDLVRSGLTDFDAISDGLEPGEVTVVCGRPGHGKTLFGLQYVKHAVQQQGKSAVILSLEMRSLLLMQRLMASWSPTGVHQDVLAKRRAPTTEEYERLLTAQAELAELPLYIDDSTYQTGATIATGLRRHIARHGKPDVVMLDHLGLMSTTQQGERRDLVVAEMTRNLKILAGELDVAILLLHQLNRDYKARACPRPVIGDLRDSGAVEQDAFSVFGVWTPMLDDPDDRKGETELIKLKDRQRGLGRATVAWQPHYGRFADMAA